MSNSSERARFIELLRTLSFERRRVTLASGRESNFFVDCKQTILTAEGHALAGSLMFDALAQLPEPVQAVAGVELGGCPLASAVSLISFQKGRPLPAFYVRKASKDHGTKKLVEGDKSIVPNMTVALLEDVVTTGGSSLRAVESLKAVGVKVVGVIALVDRLEDNGRETIEAAGLPLISLATRRDFMDD
jgi:orotate phosphoribosyltransferase